ncbi:MAG: thioesterase family protein [Archangium sp.]|nr:thioesterase family protein [Archangium sp.]
MAPAPEGSFSSFVTPVTLAPNRYGFDFPDGWQTGKGLFGGLVVGALVRALEASAGPSRPLRSITSELCGPTQPGSAEIHVELLREGAAVSTLTARLVQDGKVQGHAVGVFGAARSDARKLTELRPLPQTDWRTIESIPVQPPIGPAFARFYDFRPVSGLPFSGETKPTTSIWIRPKNPGPARDAAFIAGCADACWPTLFIIDEAPRPMATIAFTMQLVSSLDGLDPDAPLFHVGRGVSVNDGYLVEFRELWGHDGRLVALNQQTIAIVR